MMVISDVLSRYKTRVNPLFAERRLELALVVALLLLALQLAWGVTRQIVDGGPAPIPPAADSLSVLALEQQPEVSDDASAEIVSRPLFWASRRPAQAPDETAPKKEKPKAAATTLKGVRVVGVFGSGETGGAIVIVKGKRQRVAVDDELEGWTLESIAPDRAIFVSAGGRDEKMLSMASLDVQYNAPATSASPAVPTRVPGQKVPIAPLQGIPEAEASEEQSLSMGGR
ncbi:type II secretion system protein N [Halioglobus pacificus]|uniref:Type II secretion system protein GspC N-terminal domain-containing protein n=1 Tax=Parahalioglobus pacificus TaxID=930806 RepID=A0A918XM02_9GAMM|nr:type II secretion system protein N [Halioglobus pacificus]GHD37923.1 hypothetical protein GCM10007053_27600 [Halioglobus pacificus]